MAFTDRARIIVSSGKGGDGHVSFRREKFVPAGGPDGGDGGNGGDVIFEVDEGQNTLEDFRHVRKYAAQAGQDGGTRRCSGRNGESIVLKVPEGTVIKDAGSGRVIADMSGERRRYVLLRGGHGGNGNQHYATSTMQAPKYAQSGQPARSIELLLELKVIADVGLVGFPNVGKSTLLSMVSNAKPKIANYHFTTLNPILGVVDLPDAPGFVMADIPGLIEGAAEGVGLGHQFLAHIERTKVLVHVVDAAGSEGRDPVEDIEAINRELAAYSIGLSEKKQIIVANKYDLIPEGDDPVRRIREKYEPLGIRVFAVSAATGDGIRELLYYISGVLASMPHTVMTYDQEFDPETELILTEDDFTVSYDEENKEYFVSGAKVERMLGYTNLNSEKGFLYFQKFLESNGILDALRELGMQEGDTVRIFGHSFEYYE
ncbi:GTPase ObgE [Lachnoclostridium sp. Marseille-P6806]|uniref:GTPase ObgE n=1 Tax=Lachnoclostridium sp. Marseille-P6806 TaxID=2364793 RepID=UPI0010326C21|nr:GTPase ObgE [Lachnoclostridium sp. Marseille-P6806]